jgi:hypothetical protein
LISSPTRAAAPRSPDEPLAEYFDRETARIEAASPIAGTTTPAEWNARRPEWRRQLREMRGLDAPPERTYLRATVTGTLDAKEFTVEKIHFQSAQ